MMRSWFRPLVVGLALSACSGDGTGPSGRVGEFTTDRSAYRPYEVVTVTLSGAMPPAGQDIEGTLGSEEVLLVADGDSALAFMMPGTPGGTRTLEFSIGATRYSGPVTVLSVAPVADPVQYMDAVTAQADAAISAAEAELDSDGYSGTARAMLQEARDSLAAFQSHWASMSGEERAALALLVRTGMEEALSFQHTARFQALSAGVVHETLAGPIPSECAALATALDAYKCTWEAFATHLRSTAELLGYAYLAGKSTKFTGMFGFGAAAFLTTAALLDAAPAVKLGLELIGIHALMVAHIGLSFIPGGSDLIQISVLGSGSQTAQGAFALAALAAGPPSTMTTLTKDVPVTFTFQPRVRRVQAGDGGVGLPWLSTGLHWLNSFNEFVGRLSSSYRVAFQAPSTALLDAVPATQVSVEVVSGNVQLADLQRSGNTVTMRFTTPAATQQSFTYDVIYTSGVYPPMRVRHEAVLHPPALRMTTPDGVPVSGELEFLDATPRQFLLRDESGSAVAGLDYSLISTRTLQHSAVTAVPSVPWGSAGFSLTLSTSGDVPATTTFDVLYDGAVIQTVQARVVRGNPPVLGSLVFGCSSDGKDKHIEVPFSVTDGPPFEGFGAYSGAPGPDRYHVRLEILQNGQWQVAANSYRAILKSGDGWNGVAEVQVSSVYSYVRCERDSYSTDTTTWGDGARIYFVDRYSQQSNMLNFSLSWFTRPGG